MIWWGWVLVIAAVLAVIAGIAFGHAYWLDRRLKREWNAHLADVARTGRTCRYCQDGQTPS